MTPNTIAPHRCPALLLAATGSGQGKTSLTAALARHHRRAGRRVRVFKTGPDFLDPMILAQASGSNVEPLDLWMVGADECRRLLCDAAAAADILLIEGAMGLFDGEPSAADLAEAFGLPVAALIDARGLGQTFGALALGLCRYRPALPFVGVIANQVGSARHAEMIRAGLPAGIRLLANLPRLPENATLPRRHLGLVQAEEIADLEVRLETMAETLAGTPLSALPPAVDFPPPPPVPPPTPRLAGVTIAVARDAAFSFLYEANLRLLRALGARLTFFSPLTDRDVEAAAVYLPGGYPELHLDALSANRAMHRCLCAHAAAGRPIYAECGGMLYLLEQLADRDGADARLVGLLPGSARMQPRLVGLGMQSLRLPTGELRGHSFHHSSLSTSLAPLTHGQRRTGAGPGEPFFWQGPVRASYLHLYFASSPAAAASLFLPE